VAQVASGAWKQALDAVVPAVVVLKVTQTRSFDTESAGSAYATGFVVDRARGLILTNRHVITPGGLGATQQRVRANSPARRSVASGAPTIAPRHSPPIPADLPPTGPVVAEAVFLNREEVPVHPLYYDPGVQPDACFRHAGTCGSPVCSRSAPSVTPPLTPIHTPRSARLWVHAL
jgi:hypothetical protein